MRNWAYGWFDDEARALGALDLLSSEWLIFDRCKFGVCGNRCPSCVVLGCIQRPREGLALEFGAIFLLGFDGLFCDCQIRFFF